MRAERVKPLVGSEDPLRERGGLGKKGLPNKSPQFNQRKTRRPNRHESRGFESGQEAGKQRKQSVNEKAHSEDASVGREEKKPRMFGVG